MEFIFCRLVIRIKLIHFYLQHRRSILYGIAVNRLCNQCLTVPTYLMPTQLFNVCDHDQLDTSKTLTVFKYYKLPIKHYKFVTCFSSFETKTRCFILLFALADIRYNVREAPFFEQKI